MKMVTWKINALTTKTDIFLLNASVDVTRFSHIEKGYCPVFITTPAAYRLFKRDTHVLGNLGSQLFVPTR